MAQTAVQFDSTRPSTLPPALPPIEILDWEDPADEWECGDTTERGRGDVDRFVRIACGARVLVCRFGYGGGIVSAEIDEIDVVEGPAFDRRSSDDCAELGRVRAWCLDMALKFEQECDT